MPVNPFSQKESWKMFDQIASTYDKLNHILSLNMDLVWRKKLTHYLPKNMPLYLLDLATGTGDQLFTILKERPQTQKIIGLDLSQEMLKIAKKKQVQSLHKNQIEFIHADAIQIPFQDNTFDAVTFSFGIRNVADPLASLSEIWRVLKPKGKALILEFSIPSPPFSYFYLAYLRYILPSIGALFSKQKDAYLYLNKTIETFPSGSVFCSLMQQSGFDTVFKKSMAFGAVTLYVGQKP